jgi:hypothetical protein
LIFNESKFEYKNHKAVEHMLKETYDLFSYFNFGNEERLIKNKYLEQQQIGLHCWITPSPFIYKPNNFNTFSKLMLNPSKILCLIRLYINLKDNNTKMRFIIVLIYKLT